MFNTKINVNALTQITLTKHKMWSIDGDRRGDVISCISGVLWITQEGDLKDYILEAGRNFWVTKPGTLVLQALDDSTFKYRMIGMQNHIEINHQPTSHKSHSRVSRLLR